MRSYLTMIAAGVVAVVAVEAASALLAHFGVADLRLDSRTAAEWLATRGLKIVVILIAASVVIRAARLAIGALRRRLTLSQGERDLEWQRRASTISGILNRLVTVAVWFVAGLMLLRELAIDVLPLLTGAGIAGLAIGFGAQNLVRDVISGFFLILEDQIRVGDAARINGVGGSIEEVNLRTIVLRDGEGAVHVFPNGTVTSLANLSKQFSFAIVDIKINYNENLERVFGTIREIGAAMQSDLRWSSLLLAPIEAPGIDSINDGVFTVRVRFKTQPLSQGAVASELRRRLVTAMVGRGIKPYAS